MLTNSPWGWILRTDSFLSSRIPQARERDHLEKDLGSSERQTVFSRFGAAPSAKACCRDGVFCIRAVRDGNCSHTRLSSTSGVASAPEEPKISFHLR